MEPNAHCFGWFRLYFTIDDGISHCMLVCRGVGGCLCPNSSRMILMYTASRTMMKRPTSSTSVADDMTFVIMCAMLSTAPLFGGTVVSLERKKCLPALLCALVLLK